MKAVRGLVFFGLAAMLLACGGSSEQGANATATERAPEAVEESEEFASESVEFDDEEFGSEDARILDVVLSPNPPISEEPIRVEVRTSDSEASPDDLEYSWKVTGRSFGGNSSMIKLPKLKKGDEVRVSVTYTQGSEMSDVKEATALVANRPPHMRNLELRRLIDPEEGEQWVAEAWAEDPDGDELEYRYTWLVNGKPSSQDGQRFSTRELKRGDDVRVSVVATDGEDESRSAESGSVTIANAAPEIRSTPPMLGNDGKFLYPLEAEDPDGDRSLRYELVSGPRGMEMDPLSGELRWTPELDQAGNHRVEVAVDDQKGGRATQVFHLPIIVKNEDGDSVPAKVR